MLLVQEFVREQLTLETRHPSCLSYPSCRPFWAALRHLLTQNAALAYNNMLCSLSLPSLAGLSNETLGGASISTPQILLPRVSAAHVSRQANNLEYIAFSELAKRTSVLACVLPWTERVPDAARESVTG